jgi:phosphate butyryltransferase
MIFESINSLKEAVTGNVQAMRCVVVLPDDLNTLEAVMQAQADTLIKPVLIGDRKLIEKSLMTLNYDGADIPIYDEKYSEAAICLAVDMVYGGDCECIMKGNINTTTFMKGLLRKENRFSNGGIVSMISFRELPNYHKLIAFTDTGICPHPNLEQKKAILENAVGTMRAMGVEKPKVAILAPSHEPNVKMPESIDAAALKRYNEDGLITDCIIEGPIAIDIALSKKAAELNNFVSPVAGDADLLLFPDLASATITSKAITYVTGKPPGILVSGTKTPVIICSRSSSMETKYLGIMLAVAGKFSQSQTKTELPLAKAGGLNSD